MANTETINGTPPRIIRDKAFAKRLNEACDTNKLCPPYNYGRLTWLRDTLAADHGISVSIETVRKWFAGEARPRPDKMQRVAMLLHVDEAWLSLGITPEMEPTDRQAHNAIAPGAVNLVAGLIQLSGGHPAFPEKTNDTAANLFAIIGGRSHHFYVTLGTPTGETNLKFVMPANVEKVIVIGVVRAGPLRFELIRFDTKQLGEVVKRRGGFSELVVAKGDGGYATGDVRWDRLKSFQNPLLAK